MKNRGAIGFVFIAAGTAGSPLLAEPWTFNGTATVRAGYEANPYIQPQTGLGTSTSRNSDSGGAGSGGITILGTATRDAALSSTTVMASADRTFYTSRYGNNSNYLLSLSRTQHFTDHLQADAAVNYQNTLNPQNNFGFNPTTDTSTTVDYLTVGSRTQRIDGRFNIDWAVGARDTLRFGGTASHSSYKSQLGSNYDQIGANTNYLHKLDRRTQIGFDLTYTHVRNAGFPSSEAYQATVRVVREISSHIHFEGAVGAVKQKSGAQVGNGTSVLAQPTVNKTTLAFNGTLCANYSQAQICLDLSRTAAPSGVGGLRTDTQARISGSYSLSERSRVTLGATYDQSSGSTTTFIPRQRYYDLNLNYSRQLNQRISVGAVGRVQKRETQQSVLFPGQSPTGYSLSATLSYSFGRIGR